MKKWCFHPSQKRVKTILSLVSSDHFPNNDTFNRLVSRLSKLKRVKNDVKCPDSDFFSWSLISLFLFLYWFSWSCQRNIFSKYSSKLRMGNAENLRNMNSLKPLKIAVIQWKTKSISFVVELEYYRSLKRETRYHFHPFLFRNWWNETSENNVFVRCFPRSHLKNNYYEELTNWFFALLWFLRYTNVDVEFVCNFAKSSSLGSDEIRVESVVQWIFFCNWNKSLSLVHSAIKNTLQREKR